MIASRGIPSKEALWLPPFTEVPRFQDEKETQTKNLFKLEQVVSFVFPSKYQPKYHEIGLRFISNLIEKGGHLKTDEIVDFIKSNKISKATFYNRVLPRLRKLGLIKIEREIVEDLRATRKRRKLKISISKTFGNYLAKIADSWLALVDEARSKS